MKKFLIKGIFVFLTFALVLCVMTRMAYKSEFKRLKRNLTFPKNILAAAVGDSRVEVYFDPDEIPWMRNLGMSAMPFTVSAKVAKLSAILNPDLKLLVVDVWPDKFFENLSCPYSDGYTPNIIALFELMTRKDMRPPGDGFPVRLSAGVLNPWLKNTFSPSDYGRCMVGGFFKNRKTIKPEWFNIENMRKIKFGPPEEPVALPGVPTGGEIVLEHLLSDLSQYDIHVVLTSTPILWYEYRWTEEARNYFERRMREISEKFNVPWYNWMHWYQNQAEYWADGTHLNDIGAKVFSRDVRKILERYVK